MQKTYGELKDLDIIVGGIYARFPLLKQGKFGYAYTQFVKKNYIPTLKEYNDEINFIRINCALTNPTTKELLTDDKNARGYKFSPEGLIDCIKKENELTKQYNDMVIEIIPYICSEIIEDLTEEEIAQLKGLILA